MNLKKVDWLKVSSQPPIRQSAMASSALPASRSLAQPEASASGMADALVPPHSLPELDDRSRVSLDASETRSAPPSTRTGGAKRKITLQEYHRQRYERKRPHANDLGGMATIGDGIDVRQSTLQSAGGGLFATRWFAKGEYITLYDGAAITREHAEKLTPSLQTHVGAHAGCYVAGLRDAISGRGGGSFANDPRIYLHPETQEVCIDQSKRERINADKAGSAYTDKFCIKAKRFIAPDEEIFLSYGDNPATAMGCGDGGDSFVYY